MRIEVFSRTGGNCIGGRRDGWGGYDMVQAAPPAAGRSGGSGCEQAGPRAGGMAVTEEKAFPRPDCDGRSTKLAAPRPGEARL